MNDSAVMVEVGGKFRRTGSFTDHHQTLRTAAALHGIKQNKQTFKYVNDKLGCSPLFPRYKRSLASFDHTYLDQACLFAVEEELIWAFYSFNTKMVTNKRQLG